MTVVKAVMEAIYCEASIETINVPFQLWLLQRHVNCCKDFGRLLKRFIKLQTLQESFSINLMQRPGTATPGDGRRRTGPGGPRS